MYCLVQRSALNLTYIAPARTVADAFAPFAGMWLFRSAGKPEYLISRSAVFYAERPYLWETPD